MHKRLTAGIAILCSLVLQLIAIVITIATYSLIHDWHYFQLSALEIPLTFICLFIGGFIAGGLALLAIFQSIQQPDRLVVTITKFIFALLLLFTAATFAYALVMFLVLI